MIYTIGHKATYDAGLEANGNEWCNLGRQGGYRGGAVWRTRQEVQRAADANDGYAVYGVLADWERDTEAAKTPEGHGKICPHDLLRTSRIVRLEEGSDDDMR